MAIEKRDVADAVSSVIQCLAMATSEAGADAVARRGVHQVVRTAVQHHGQLCRLFYLRETTGKRRSGQHRFDGLARVLVPKERRIDAATNLHGADRICRSAIELVP